MKNIKKLGYDNTTWKNPYKKIYGVKFTTDFAHNKAYYTVRIVGFVVCFTLGIIFPVFAIYAGIFILSAIAGYYGVKIITRSKK